MRESFSNFSIFHAGKFSILWRYTLGCPPSQVASDHQDCFMFRIGMDRGFQPKPSFATGILGRGTTQGILLSLKSSHHGFYVSSNGFQLVSAQYGNLNPCSGCGCRWCIGLLFVSIQSIHPSIIIYHLISLHFVHLSICLPICLFIYLSIYSYIRANPLSSGYQFRLVSKFHMFGLLGHAWVPDISSIPLHRRHDFKLDRLTSMSWALSLVVKPPTWIGGNLDFQVSHYHHSRRVVQKHMFNHVQFFKSV